MLFEIILKIITLKKIFDKIQIFQKNNFSKFVAKTVLKFIGQDLIAKKIAKNGVNHSWRRLGRTEVCYYRNFGNGFTLEYGN